MSLNAVVTLVTTDAYVPGALVAVHSLLEAEGKDGRTPEVPFETVCLITPATLSVQSIKSLRQNFSLVVGVEEIRSGNGKELALLGRTDLASTLTKLHIFRLVQFRRIIFLDADTLCLRPLSHLFTLDAPFSAAPDSGWPDCFNSGMFVATPSAATFDGLMEMARDRGSWDGGDQGLLNDYFPNWNRLSFTYNTTPSAYYTYAPAYRRHGADIKIVHFIGRHKPWHENGPSRSVPETSQDVGASDYASLVNKWFSVYHRYFAAGNANQSTFTFPKLQAIWNQDGKSGAVPYRYVPPSMEELKRSFQGQGASSSSFISGKGTSQQQSIEGHYVSMPIQAGIPDLSKPVIFTSPSSPPRSPSPTVTITAPTPPIGPSAQPHFENPQIHVRSPSPQAAPAVPQHTAPARAWSPPNVAWDPARSEPPKNDKPQMSVAWDNQYQNTWDAPRSPASKKFFVAPEKYAPMPAVTHQDYSRHTQQSVPSSSQGQASQTPSNFPWESQQRAPPTRVFPGEPKPKPIVQTIPMPSRNSAAQGPMTPSLNPGSGSAAFSGQYTNAWDNVAGIQRYATHLKERNSPRPRSYRQASYTNSQTPANSSHQAQAASSSSTQQYSSPHNNSHLAPNSSHSHSRNASTGSFYGQERQYGGRGGNSVTRNGNGSTQQQTSPRKNENNASSSGYETGGEASSRDGDDEDEADDEDDGPLDSRSHPSRSRNNTSASGPSQPTSSARYAPLRGNSSENTTQVNSNTSPPSVLSTSLPPATSNGTYQSQSVSRVFDQRTDPDVIRKEGLGALQRFVRNMEARGAAQENGASSPVNGSKPSSRQHSPTIAR